MRAQPENEGEINEQAYVCSECRSGVVRLQFLTYFTWLNEELVTVPNFPAWVCDVCGKREYDPRAVAWLNAMLNPSAGKHPPLRRKPDSSQQDRPRP